VYQVTILHSRQREEGGYAARAHPRQRGGPSTCGACAVVGYYWSRTEGRPPLEGMGPLEHQRRRAPRVRPRGVRVVGLLVAPRRPLVLAAGAARPLRGAPGVIKGLGAPRAPGELRCGGRLGGRCPLGDIVTVKVARRAGRRGNRGGRGRRRGLPDGRDGRWGDGAGDGCVVHHARSRSGLRGGVGLHVAHEPLAVRVGTGPGGEAGDGALGGPRGGGTRRAGGGGTIFHINNIIETEGRAVQRPCNGEESAHTLGGEGTRCWLDGVVGLRTRMDQRSTRGGRAVRRGKGGRWGCYLGPTHGEEGGEGGGVRGQPGRGQDRSEER
jgi:hypothetical protein